MRIEEAGTDIETGVVDTAEVIEGLNDLLRLDHDAVASYEIAIERLKDAEHAMTIQGFLRDHQAHIRRLNEVITDLGGTPANEPHVTGPLKEAIQALGETIGDRGLLMAWRANEFQVMTKYDRYAARAVHWPPRAKRVVDENALDEERHYAWVTDVLGIEDPREIHLANRIRELLGGSSFDPRRALTEEIRAHPARSLLVAFTLGLLAGRFIR